MAGSRRRNLGPHPASPDRPASPPVSTFSVSFGRLGAARVLALTGDLDAHTAPEFEAALLACLAEGDARIVADGSGLTYVSSAGLGVFMSVVEPAREAGGDVVIAALPPRVFETFDLLGFPEVFRFAPTAAAAAALFGDAPAGDAPAGDVAAS